MGCFSSKPAVVESHYPATQQPIYTPTNNNGVPLSNAYQVHSAYNGIQQQQPTWAAPSAAAAASTATRPGLHATVLRALTEPNEAYFQIIDQLDRNTADIHALDPSGSGQTALHVAAASGLDSIVELLLERGAHADVLDASGDTALHLASKMGKLDAVRSLLNQRYGADGAAVINATNNEGLTPLVLAVFESLNVDLVHELLQHGADPNVSIMDDGTAVHLMTVTPGFENVVREAVRCGGDLEARDTHGNTALHLSAQYGKTSLLEFFLNQKPDLAKAENILGQTAYAVAVENGHTESAELLSEWAIRHAAFSGDADSLVSAISSGAAHLSSPLDSFSNTAVHLLAEKNHSTQLEALLSDVTRPEVDAMLTCTNVQGNTALHLAAEHGNTDIILSLAVRSSSLQEAMSVANADGLTPLLLAAQKGHVQVVHELLNEVPSGVMQGDENLQNTALHFAAQEGHLNIVELLLARGADVNARNKVHQTPLHLAATWNEALVVHRLLECGADPAAVDDQGKTPLELARMQDHMELWHAMLGSQLRRAVAIGDLIAVMSALTCGALVDSKNNTSGDTSLHVAAKNGHADILGTLLDHSPDPAESLTIFNDAGDAPLHVAARAGETDVIRVALSVPGVDPNMTTADGETALHIASGEGWIQAVQELFKGDAELDKCSEGRGSTALHDAACSCDLSMVKTLLQLGADPNAKDSFSGNTPLHAVALWGQPDGCGAIIHELTAAGADPKARNNDGKTPSELARATATRSRATSAAENSLEEAGNADLLGIQQVEEEDGRVLDELGSLVMAPPPPPPPTELAEGKTVASTSAWDYSVTPPASAPMESTVPPPPALAAPAPVDLMMQPSTTTTPATATTLTDTAVVPAIEVPNDVIATTAPETTVGVVAEGQNTTTTTSPGPARVPSDYYPDIYATDDDPSSVPPTVPSPTRQAPCVPLKSVRAAAAGPPPSSPFAAAPIVASPFAPTRSAINPAALNPLSAPPRSRTTASENGQPTPQRVSTASEPSAATTPTTAAAGSTSILDNRLLIPYNQLKYDSRAHLVGQGSFGRVFRGILHGNRVAIKILFQRDDVEYSIIQQPPPTGEPVSGGIFPTTNNINNALSQQMMEDFVREVDMMAGLRHDNVQDLRGYSITPEGPAIVSKYYARGSMADALRQGLSNPEKRAELTWTRRLHMAVDVAAGLLYMHSYQPPILHRDLKAINCFLDEHYRALVGDFGLTKPMQDRARSAASSGAVANNPRWLAPELTCDSELGESHYTTKTDIYAFGMVMFELLTWREPFKNTGHWEIINKIGRGARPVIPTPMKLPGTTRDNEIFIQGGVMEEYVQLMNRCWAQDPSKRPEFEEIHPQLEKMLLKHVQNVRAARESANGGGGGGGAGGQNLIGNVVDNA